MKILITGVAGFLGSHLADALIEQNNEIIGIDSLIGGDIKNVHPKVSFYEFDLCNFESIKPLFAGVDVVYHCAATAHEGFSVFSPRFITKNIVDASISTITAAIANKVPRFINLSSMARYGTNTVPFREDMLPQPQDPYGIGKVCVENLLKNLSEIHGMEWITVVPHNIIGPRQKYNDPYRNVASIMINRILQGKAPVIYGDGKQRRCFSFVQDIVEPLVLLANSKIVNQIINLGPDEDFVTINELAYIILDLMHSKLLPVYTESRPQEVKFANCSANKARELLGYVPKTSLREGLQAMINAVKKPKAFDYSFPLEIINDKTPFIWKKHLM